MDQTDILLSGESGLMALTGLPAEIAVRRRLDAGTGIIALKNGLKKTRIVTRDLDLAIPSCPVEEVDPTYASDCFEGAFLAAYLTGHPIEEAGRIANAAGAFNMTKMGPMEGKLIWRTFKIY